MQTRNYCQLIAITALVTACGNAPNSADGGTDGSRASDARASSDGARMVTSDVAPPPGVPANTPAYEIDPGDFSGAPGAYIITTNGQGDWILGWQGDTVSHHYTGNIYCPVGCTLTATFANALPGDSINTVATNHVGFDAITDASNRQSITISTNGSPQYPVTFDLYIDNQPAIDSGVAFSSGGQASTSTVMPFDLIPRGTMF